MLCFCGSFRPKEAAGTAGLHPKLKKQTQASTNAKRNETGIDVPIMESRLKHQNNSRFTSFVCMYGFLL